MCVQYFNGDATRPTGAGNKIIAHVCNDLGRWGKGFVMAISRRWPEPAEAYKTWFREAVEFHLGAVQFVRVESDLWMANMIGQQGLAVQNGLPPIRYEAVRTALQSVAMKARELNSSVHMPRIGCGLAGGEWALIEPIIVETLCAHGVEVTVYDLSS